MMTAAWLSTRYGTDVRHNIRDWLQHERTDGVEDSLVSVIQFLWVVVVSCLVTGCLGSFSDHIKMDPTTVEDLRRQVPVYRESDVQTRAYVLLQQLSAISCKNKLWDAAPTQEEATDQLRVKAARLGGNGLVNVVCEAPSITYVSKNCWAWLTCHGAAIKVTR